MIKVEPADEESLKFFEYDGIEKVMLDKLNWREQLMTYHKIGRVWKVMNEAKNPVMLYGLFEISKGVLSSWMLFNRAAGFYSKAIAAHIKEHLKAELKNYHRVQTLVFAGDKAAGYVQLMGFKKESVMKCFGPDKQDAEVWVAL